VGGGAIGGVDRSARELSRTEQGRERIVRMCGARRGRGHRDRTEDEAPRSMAATRHLSYVLCGYRLVPGKSHGTFFKRKSQVLLTWRKYIFLPAVI
jgi:hypothetical protein